MAVVRTRLLFWLFKAYVKKWGKLFIIFFLVGLATFLLLLRFYPLIIHIVPTDNKTIIGISGTYTKDKIPEFILKKVGRGLTKVETDGKISPDLASSWEIKDNGKTYNFKLKKDIKFSDGTRFTSRSIQYSFKDVTISRPDDETISFKLKDGYAPFLVTVSKPIFNRGFNGAGIFMISDIELNGEFIKSIQLVSTENKFKTEEYIFYPTAESLKTAFALGEVTEAHGLTETSLKNTDLSKFPNLEIEKKHNYSKLITIFFNTADPVLSDKKWRAGLSYALPDQFYNIDRVYSPYFPNSYFINDTLAEKRHDLIHAQLLIDSAMETASSSSKPELKLKTLKKYSKTAASVKESWGKIGIKVTIEEVENVPQIFQVYLGDFNVPSDPDQYSLWHSGQGNNITNFKNLRIDKLLEDGRRSIDLDERLRIYNDFQKYLLDESPAAFLYFPLEYNIKRS